MNAWEELSDHEYDEAWDRFYKQFQFYPSTSRGYCPGISEPIPSETYKISHIYDHDDVYYDTLNVNLQGLFLKYFRTLASDNDWVYALDWQHPGYRFYPHIAFELDEFGEWPVPIPPNGDYYIFLEKDFRYGVFGHPWQQTMCIFGNQLLVELKKEMPKLFTDRIRVNGEKT
jgi:hypothetical protein